jgi:formylglycine-generating enzyme required for sulfatase activity
MRKIALTVLIVLFSIIVLIACGQKEETAVEEAASEGAEPAVIPGEMVLIPAGEFIFGLDEKDSSAYPQQTLTLPAFWIDKYEVTNSEFLDFSIKENYTGEGAKLGQDWRTFFTADKARVPVVYITWADANAYCTSMGKRLPTEEEWEKAARGTDGRRYPWGNEFDPYLTNTYEAGPRKPADIGQFPDISPYGVHDMLGNVQEWTASWYKTYKGNPRRIEDSGEKFRVVRGLSYSIYGSKGHLALRSRFAPEALYDIGVRCAKDATPEEAAAASQAD